MGDKLLRLYTPELDRFDLRDGGYPWEWAHGEQPIKDLVREQAGHRCVRCGHPFLVRTGLGRWSPCDRRCTHAGPCRGKPFPGIAEAPWRPIAFSDEWPTAGEWSRYMPVEAEYRILTVHHLDGDKANCRWWNLMAACQRCHLEVQGKVVMDRVWPHEHTAWFQSYVAGFYAHRYLDLDLTREEALARLDELLALEVRQLSLEAVRA